MKPFTPSVDKATAYCTYCPKMCRFTCPAAEAENRETVTPWGLMRLLEFVKNGTVEPSAEVAEIFMHCMGCKGCETWCKHENDVPEAMWQARAWLKKKGFVAEALDGFDEFFYEGNSPHAEPKSFEEAGQGDAISEAFDDNARIAFFVDCETRRHEPELIPRIGLLLEDLLGEKTRLITRDSEKGFGCCGFPVLSAGDQDGYKAYRRRMEFELRDVDYVLTDCAAFADLHREGGSFGGFESELEVVHIVEFLADLVPELPVKERASADGLMLHDSCFVGRHLQLYEATRSILNAVCDAPPEEFQFTREDTPCCGGPAHYHVVAPEASEACTSTRIQQMEREGGQRIVCASSTCNKSFRRVKDQQVSTVLLDLVCTACGF